MAALARHSWPGNVRELQNFIERSVILSTGAALTGSLPEATATLKLSVPMTLEDAERSHILHTLEQTEGVIGGRDGAAARLGLARTTLISKMRRLGVSRFQRPSALAPEVAAQRRHSASPPSAHDSPMLRRRPTAHKSEATCAAQSLVHRNLWISAPSAGVPVLQSFA